MASHRGNCAGARVYHKTGENPGTVTIRYSRRPTTKIAKITKIVTILHSPEIPGLLRMRIIITPTGVGNRENENHYHS
jgi:hypothetical protein